MTYNACIFNTTYLAGMLARSVVTSVASEQLLRYCSLQFARISAIFPEFIIYISVETATTWSNHRSVWRLDASVFSSTSPGDVATIDRRKIHLSPFSVYFCQAFFSIFLSGLSRVRAL